ncbi:MAG: glycoside hydrolase family 88 protein [Bacteroidales bacterium]|nr:glycoside hydrolase family 88 protein [Bacteroidales bacterium]
MLTILLALLVAVTPAQIVSSEMTRCPDATYMDFREGKKVWDYATGLELKAFLDAYAEAACPRAAFDYAERWYDAMVDEDGVPFGYKVERYNIDHICPGRTLIPLYQATGKEKYRKALQLLHTQISTQPRTVEGGYWHKGIYPHQIWLDGLYMGEPFLVEYAAAFGTEAQFREACAESMQQFLTAAKVTFDPETGLLRHAYDASRQMFWCHPDTGQSAHCWARALGWYCMSAVEVLETVPEDTPGREALVAELRRIIGVLPQFADKKSGMWYQVLDQPGRKGNYLEATACAMFTYAILKGVRIGVLDASLLEYGKTCWQNLLDTFVTVDSNGLVNLNQCCTVGGLGGKAMRKGDFDYYISEPVKSNDPKGIGPFIWAALEMERLGTETRYAHSYTVAQDGSGDFLTVQEAVNACPDYSHKVITTIYIKAGLYRECVTIPHTKFRLHFIGEGAEKTVISWNKYARGCWPGTEDKIGTSGSASVYIHSSYVTFEDIGFENTAGEGEAIGQAVAVFTDGDFLYFKRCRFIGNQDTLYTYGKYGKHGGVKRNYYLDCYIEGTTDFIFGPSVCWFERCTLHSKKNSYITAASTFPGQKWGYVFHRCTLTAAPGVDACYLGRPWGAFARTVFLECEMGAHIRPEGWRNWNKPDKPNTEANCYYAEWGNTGPGASTAHRVWWARQLTDEQAAEYTFANVMYQPQDGIVWDPENNF